MDCFSNLIGIQNGCGDVQQPTAKLWLTQHTGISLQNADAVISAQYADGMALLLSMRDLAMQDVINRVRVYVSNHMRMNNIVDSGVVGWPKDNLPTVAAESNIYKGLQFDLAKYPYSSLEVTSIRLQSQYTGTVTIKVIDLVTAKEIDTFDITTVAGEISETIVNKTYTGWNKRLNLAIVYDATGIASYKSTTAYNQRGCSTCSGGWVRDIINARGVYFSTSATPTQNATRALGHTAGLSITYNVSCDAEPFLCSLGNKMAWPIFQLWGAYVYKEMAYTQRLNSIIYFKSNAKELRQECEDAFEDAMKSLFQNIQLPKDICFGCNPPLRKVVQLP